MEVREEKYRRIGRSEGSRLNEGGVDEIREKN